MPPLLPLPLLPLPWLPFPLLASVGCQKLSGLMPVTSLISPFSAFTCRRCPETEPLTVNKCLFVFGPKGTRSMLSAGCVCCMFDIRGEQPYSMMSASTCMHKPTATSKLKASTVPRCCHLQQHALANAQAGTGPLTAVQSCSCCNKKSPFCP